jgi:hypothetical protein
VVFFAGFASSEFIERVLLESKTKTSPSSELTEVLDGREVAPIPGSLIQDSASSFKEREALILRTESHLAEVLKLLPPPFSSIDLGFQPDSEIAVVATLGELTGYADAPPSRYVALDPAIQRDGLLEIRPVEYVVRPDDQMEAGQEAIRFAPFVFARYPRSLYNGLEVAYQLLPFEQRRRLFIR